MKAICKVLVDPSAMALREFPSLHPLVSTVTIALAANLLKERDPDIQQAFEEFLQSSESSKMPRTIYPTNWIGDAVDPLSLLHCVPDALALVQHKEHLENIPEGSDEGLEILWRRLRHINIVENMHPRHSELWQMSDFLPNGNKKVDGIYMLLNSTDSLGNNGMNLNYLDLATCRTLQEVVATTGCLGEDIQHTLRPPEGTKTHLKTHQLDSKFLETDINEIIEFNSLQLMSTDYTRPLTPNLVLTSTDVQAVSAIHLVVHHVESAQQHADDTPNPQLNVSFTSDAAVLISSRRCSSDTHPVTFLEFARRPAHARIQAPDHTFSVNGCFYVLFITPEDSPMAADLAAHLHPHPCASTDEDVNMTGAGIATEPFIDVDGQIEWLATAADAHVAMPPPSSLIPATHDDNPPLLTLPPPLADTIPPSIHDDVSPAELGEIITRPLVFTALVQPPPAVPYPLDDAFLPLDGLFAT